MDEVRLVGPSPLCVRRENHADDYSARKEKITGGHMRKINIPGFVIFSARLYGGVFILSYFLLAAWRAYLNGLDV